MKLKTKISVLGMLACHFSHAYAMQPLNDGDLQQSTGQDGISLSIGTVSNTGTIGFDSVALEDTDGFGTSTTYSSKAALAYVTATTGTGVSFYSGSSGSYVAIATPLVVSIDADGNTNNPVMNIKVGFNSNLSKINLNQFSLGLVSLTSGVINTTTRRNILSTGSSGVDILLNTSSPLAINMQFGNQPQGAMFVFTGGSIQKISADNPIELISYSCTSSSSCTASDSLKFNFSLAANAASTNGIQLAGMTVDPTSNGLVIAKTGTLDKFDVTLGSITMGTSATSSTSIFNGLSNASIGTIGLTGVAVSNFKATVNGL